MNIVDFLVCQGWAEGKARQLIAADHVEINDHLVQRINHPVQFGDEVIIFPDQSGEKVYRAE